jgi:topoisomerase-4 subunit B
VRRFKRRIILEWTEYNKEERIWSVYREAIVNHWEYYNKGSLKPGCPKSIVTAISIKVMEPVFESQTKTKLGSTDMVQNPNARS